MIADDGYTMKQCKASNVVEVTALVVALIRVVVGKVVVEVLLLMRF